MDAEKELSAPHIPEPDYWSDEDQDVERNTDLSTFRANEERPKPEITPESKPAPKQSDTGKPNKVLHNANKGHAPPPPPQPEAKPPQIVSKEELLSQTQKIMSKSVISSAVGRQPTTGEKSVANEQSESEDSNISKVKKNIREFERRSSICSDGTIVPQVVAITTKKEVNQSSGGQNSQNIRMSKSCFEVDVCDNSSSGLS